MTVVGLVSVTGLASADSIPPAVAPDQVTGIATPETPDDPTISRGLLFVPKLLLEGLLAPFRGATYVYEHYQLKEHVMQLLFNDAGTFGAYPTAFIESQIGLNVGLHVIDTDLFGHKEKLSVAASYGGEFQQAYSASLTSGDSLGPVTLKLRGSWQAWNRSNFFGIGNASLQSVPAPAMPIDALADPTAYHTRYGQHVTHVELDGTYDVVGPLAFGVAAAYTSRNFNNDAIVDEFVRTPTAYDPSTLVGFTRGTQNFYGELQAIVDNRSYANRYISKAAPSSGWWAMAFVGAARGVGDDPSHYTRYGADLHRFVDLYHGDRVLVLRAYLEGVTAPVGEVPFTDLPRLGGGDLLRGFEGDRFRDRVAAFGSVEYDWHVHYGVDTYLFVDTGRVAGSLDELSLSNLHTGYGIGVQLQGPDSFLFRAQIAHSVDGFFFKLALDPLADTHVKQRRL